MCTCVGNFQLKCFVYTRQCYPLRTVDKQTEPIEKLLTLERGEPLPGTGPEKGPSHFTLGTFYFSLKRTFQIASSSGDMKAGSTLKGRIRN